MQEPNDTAFSYQPDLTSVTVVRNLPTSEANVRPLTWHHFQGVPASHLEKVDYSGPLPRQRERECFVFKWK